MINKIYKFKIQKYKRSEIDLGSYENVISARDNNVVITNVVENVESRLHKNEGFKESFERNHVR